MSDWRSDPIGFNESVINEFRANAGVVRGELAHMPLLLLTTIDARAGQARTTPLAYHRRGNRYLVIASNGGAARNPTWFRHLERDRHVTVEVGVETFSATARILDAFERDAAFAAIVEDAPSAGAFEAKAGRAIPVIELAPLERHENRAEAAGIDHPPHVEGCAEQFRGVTSLVDALARELR